MYILCLGLNNHVFTDGLSNHLNGTKEYNLHNTKGRQRSYTEKSSVC